MDLYHRQLSLEMLETNDSPVTAGSNYGHPKRLTMSLSYLQREHQGSHFEMLALSPLSLVSSQQRCAFGCESVRLAVTLELANTSEHEWVLSLLQCLAC